MSIFNRINWSFFYRKKSRNVDESSEEKLPRVLTVFDLVALGVGTTLGSGIYVLSGTVIKNVAGPSLVVSFVIAAAVSIIAALCYSELGARVPKTGSAYAYTYVCVGEFMAFIIGWNLLLEYAIGSSSVSRAFSTYLDSLIDKKIETFFQKHMPMNVPDLSSYPDFFAFGFSMLITSIVSIGVKESTFMNKIFTALNLSVIMFVIVCGGIKSNLNNWKIPESKLPYNTTNSTCDSIDTCGTGGFFPFGLSGTLKGTAKCFIAFIGFDSISTTGGEVKNPEKSIPFSIITSLIICCALYCGVSTVLSLMVPYYLINQNAPMPDAFKYVELPWARYIVATGALISLATCLLSAMFALSRILYAIAEDGLVFRVLARIHLKFKTPFLATWCCGLLSASLAAIFELQELVNMTSIGTLLAYTLVALSVLILRYETPNLTPALITNSDTSSYVISDTLIYTRIDSNDKFLSSLFKPSARIPNAFVTKLVHINTGVSVSIIFLINILIQIYGEKILQPKSNPILFSILVLLITVLLVSVIIICCQPQNKIQTFQVPLVPIFPLISVFVNFYLIMVLPVATWIRFGVWMTIGFIIYFSYGIRHSNENETNKLQNLFKKEIEKLEGY